MTKTTSKKLLALLLAVIMSLSLLPVSVLAAGLDGEPEDAPQVTAPVEQQEDDTQAPTDETEDKTDDAAPADETGDKTDDAAPADETEDKTDDAAPADETGDKTDDAAPTDETEDKTDDAAPADETEDKTDDAVLPIDETDVVPTAWYSTDKYEYNIMFLDCGRKYFSVDSIKTIIDNASSAGFNYIQLAVGNDGLRFLLNDMSLKVGEATYTSEAVSAAIHAGNEAYCNFTVDELTQSEMDAIIAYANAKGMGVIPCVNSPGHMDAILSAATSLTGTNCSYSGSARTIDVTNSTAVAFTKALLQKYIDYFAKKGCTLFNMGADEYANDKFTGGSMGFGNLQSTGKYGSFVTYVNDVAAMIKNAGMTPMAFNDGIYFANNTSSGTFDTDIIICYWSNGWSGYSPMSAAMLASKGFRLVNTNGDYYWVLGKSNAQCSPTKASGFVTTTFPGSYISNPVGSMFCIWCDVPDAGTDSSVVSNTAATIAAFGGALPKLTPVQPPVVDVPKKDDKTGVSVTAPGLTELTVTEVTETPAIPNAAADKVVAFDVKPATEEGGYTGEATVSFPIPTDWDTSRIRGFVVNEDDTITDRLSGTVDGSSFTFTAPHFSVMGVYQLAEGAATTTQDVTVPVGGTTEVPVPGKKLTGPYTTDNETVASVTVTGQDATPGEPRYDGVSKSYSELAGSNTSWMKTEYFYLKDGSYYPVYAKQVTETEYIMGFIPVDRTYYYVGYSTDDGANVETVVDKKENTTIIVYTKSGTAGTPASTTITFHGKSVGNTSVIIDGVQYNISVVVKAPDNTITSDTITLEHWITNGKVTASPTENNNNATTISKNDASGPDGVAVEGRALNPAYWEKTQVYYWQAVRLDANHKQTAGNGVDQTAEGVTLTHVRYYGGAWQYKTVDGAWHYFDKNDQMVAYYLQKTEVTKEIDTYVKDWGFGTGSTTEYNGEGQVALTVAVVYPDGSVSPAEGEMYSKSTTIFNYWNNRDIGIVAPKSNGDYNISKITVTDGARTSNTSANQWYTSDTITWEKETTASGGKWYKETVVWNKDSGTTPGVNGKDTAINGVCTWSAKNTAKLVLIYLEPVVKETNLKLVYWDNNAGQQINPTEIQIVVNEGTTYTNGLRDASGTVIGDQGPWMSNDTNSPNYLPDEAYVINSSGVNQTFSKDITQLNGVADNYRSGIYEYISADISADGKTLTLHYDLKAVEGVHEFVVDFGLPVEFTDLLSWFNVADVATVRSLSLAKGTELLESQGTWGYAKINTTTWNSMTYTLNKMLSAPVTIPLYCNLKDSTEQPSTQIRIIPASTVYYEDSFVTFSKPDPTQNIVGWSRVDSAGTTLAGITTEEQNAKQALDKLGDQNANVYGYDPAYANCTTFSLGSAMKATVSGKNYATAQFTFKGTGFDIISLTSNTSGTILCTVTGENNYKKNYVVDTFYGYSYNEATNSWEVDANRSDTLYQIPVMKVTELPYGTYTVTITVAFNQLFNHGNGDAYSFWLDGVRVYNPGGSALDDKYKEDGEGWPQYIKLRSQLVDKNSFGENSSAVFIDGKENASVEDYKNYGPNNEVYLLPGQSVAFALTGDIGSIASVQIGAKAPKGSAVLQVNGEVVENLGTATEMYYDITDKATGGQLMTISNTGTDGTILSLTNVKVTYTAGGKSVNLSITPAQAEEAVMLVRAMYAPVVPETFTPDRFEARWSRSTVRAGQRATLTVRTSVDVEAITVDGETVTSYRTRTQRTGWGKNATKVTYREFTYTMTATKTADHMVTAVNAQGVASDPITATLTVQAAVQRPGWWDKLFGRWS